ncbi:hypothetical protein EMCRGX_G028651 [Ephydatia muelleri]
MALSVATVVKVHYWFFLCSVGVFLTTGSSKLSNIQLVLSFSKALEVAVLFLFSATVIFCPWFWNNIQLVILHKAKSWIERLLSIQLSACDTTTVNQSQSRSRLRVTYIWLNNTIGHIMQDIYRWWRIRPLKCLF